MLLEDLARAAFWLLLIDHFMSPSSVLDLLSAKQKAIEPD